MDKIIMRNMVFFGRHGVLQEEAELGQKFFVDVILHADLKSAGESDDLEHSISYAVVYDLVRSVVEENRFNLLEALAEHMSHKIFALDKKILGLEVEVRKPSAPVPGIFDYMAVRIERKRESQSHE